MNRLQHCPIFFVVILGITTPLSPLLTAFLTAYCVCNFNLFEYDRKPILGNLKYLWISFSFYFLFQHSLYGIIYMIGSKCDGLASQRDYFTWNDRFCDISPR